MLSELGHGAGPAGTVGPPAGYALAPSLLRKQCQHIKTAYQPSPPHLCVAGHVTVECLRLTEAGPCMRRLTLRPLTQPGLRQLGHNVPLTRVQAAGGQAVT